MHQRTGEQFWLESIGSPSSFSCLVEYLAMSQSSKDDISLVYVPSILFSITSYLDTQLYPESGTNVSQPTHSC